MEDAPAFSTLRVEVDGPIGRITLTQGDKLNPLGTTALREIALAAQWFDTTDAHVVIVTGEGRGFSAGFDLREFAGGDRENPDAASSRNQADLGRLMAESMDRMTAVTIAAIKGPCVGGGSPVCATCESPPTTPCSRSPRSTWASRWRGAASHGSSARSVQRSPASWC